MALMFLRKKCTACRGIDCVSQHVPEFVFVCVSVSVPAIRMCAFICLCQSMPAVSEYVFEYMSVFCFFFVLSWQNE